MLWREKPPYGWRLVGCDVVADPVEQLVIGEMRSWHSEGLTYAAIARRLNSDGTTAGSGRWTARAVTVVLQS